MLKHVVLFRFAPDVTEAVRQEEREAFRQSLLGLAGSHSELVESLEVGFNINEHEEWDIALVGVFADAQSLAAYAGHPDHVAAVGRLKPFLAGRACVDFEE